MFKYLLADFAEPWQVTFQDPASPVMKGIIFLHNDIMQVLLFIGGFVGYILFRTVHRFYHTKQAVPSAVAHGTTIEIIWTITPTLLLVLIATPSFTLLYAMDELIDPAITLKAIGRQWYWTYEYTDYEVDHKPIIFDSYMVPIDDLQPGQLRLLEVDNRVVLPVNTHVRLLTTGADVIHCWAMPSLGVKIDCVPGRLNQVEIFIEREGVYHGQCSELCGANHGFMPIVVEAVSLEKYLEWVMSR